MIKARALAIKRVRLAKVESALVCGTTGLPPKVDIRGQKELVGQTESSDRSWNRLFVLAPWAEVHTHAGKVPVRSVVAVS